MKKIAFYHFFILTPSLGCLYICILNNKYFVQHFWPHINNKMTTNALIKIDRRSKQKRRLDIFTLEGSMPQQINALTLTCSGKGEPAVASAMTRSST